LEYIKAKEDECLAATEDAKGLVEWNNMVINLFESAPVVVNIEDIVDELANICGIEKERLSIKLNVDVQCPLYNDKFEATRGRYIVLMSWLRNGIQKSSDGKFGTIEVEVYNGDNRILSFLIPLNVKEIQKDGKKMYEHIQIVETTSTNGNDDCYKYDIDDYRNLITKYTIKELMCEKELSYFPTPVKEAVLNIVERENYNVNEDGMSVK